MVSEKKIHKQKKTRATKLNAPCGAFSFRNGNVV